MRIGFVSLGCAKNQVSCEQMIWQAYDAGWDISLEPEDCDVAVLNTCGFLQTAKAEALEELDKLAALKAAGRLGKILVSGCLAQRYRDEIAELCPAADGFLGCGSFDAIKTAVEQVTAGEKPALFGDIDAPLPECDRVITTSDYWGWLRIAEGCDNHCAYCVIPSIRGKYRSRTEEAILAEAKSMAEAGIREIIVVAQDITRYGMDLYGEHRLADLLPKLCAVEGVEWVRLHYLYPDEIDDALIDVIAREEKIVNYLDIPIQHINDRLLKAMGRRGTGEEIRALFAKLRDRIPGLVLRTSLIVGLPGETEEDFEELCAFLREAKLERAGVFLYSPEEGSAAARMPDQVDEDVKRRRAELLAQLQMEIVDEYCRSRIGQHLKVLCEGLDPETGLWMGRSYADSPDIDGLVYFDGFDEELSAGTFYLVEITNELDGDLVGVLEEEEA